MTNTDPVILGALDRATQDFSAISDVVERLIHEVSELDPTTYDTVHLDAVRAAIGFRLLADGTFSGEYAGALSSPWPRTIDQVGPDALPVWAAYADAAASPVVRAHLHHLLTAAKANRPHVHARAAITAYRDAVPTFQAADTISTRARAAESLVHALGLARGMNQKDLIGPVVTDIVTMVEDMLDTAPPALGLLHRLLDVLIAANADSATVSALIERAVTASENDIVLHHAFLGLLRRLGVDDVGRKAVDRRIVAAMIDTAEKKRTGMPSLLLFNDAATKAQQAGLTDLAEQARKKMQAMKVQNLGIAVSRMPLQLTPAERDTALVEVDQARTLAEALWRIGAMPAPAGTDAEAERAARAVMPNAPLTTVIPRGSVNPGGPVPTAPASTDGLENTKAIYRKIAILRAGLAFEVQLDRVWERFAPSVEDLVAVLDCAELGTVSRTKMLARAFKFYSTGEDDDASVHLAVPRVEALAREIMRGRGVPMLTVAQGATNGGVVQLGTLISNMEKIGFDEDRRYSFALAFTDGERGLNVRNDVCHGLIDCPPRPVVALVLQAALHLLAVAHGVISLSAPAASATSGPSS
ncbi:hypothetical protein [Streptantibioticus ferralitis]|uniref:DUF4209 domain-containing protein n=1 Tax=Streptantibioticus ferralitis TaxID=236510 RepID=A0ABT5YS10_9ACTN|nr:hypothetical protein [Streptantibioticus ferralitis]MDF2254324.1 hypothetical protein [Streptantibioticus ferralitis]